ncbi:hypothetical protein JL721_5656 [Aureococcus anophagefferens]|nr:hypothetical protein JL721_5656 [Aureococcus anophagefferens]
MEQVLRNKKKSVRRARRRRSGSPRWRAEDEAARAADADDADGDEDNDGDDDAEGSAFAAAAIERALKTARVEAQATALLEGMDVSRRDEPAPAPSAEPPVYLEDAFRSAGYEFVDDFARRRLLRPPSREHLGAAIANAVDAQAFEVAATGYVGKQRVSRRRGRRRRAPFAKRKDLQRSFGFYRSRPQFGLSHSRHWLSPEQRAYAAADAWATLALYESLAAEGHAPAREDAPATAPRGASRSPPKPPKPTKAAGLRELSGASGPPKPAPRPRPRPADFATT